MLRKIIAIPDIQVPKHDHAALATALSIIRGEKPDEVILIGDVVDLQSVSRFAPLNWTEAAMTAAEELQAANEVLDVIDDAIPKKARKIYLEGNHDRRLELWFIQHAPRLGENFNGNNIVQQLSLDKRKYQYIKVSQQPYRIGKVGFIHGWFTNIHHAKKTIEKGGQNLIYGHCHDFSVFTGSHLDKEAPRLAMSIGCLCDFRQVYLDSRPMNWMHGIGLFYIDDKTGRFWPYFCPIIKGEAVINGRRYKG